MAQVNNDELFETDDGKWDGVIRAFWRRIQGYKKCEFNDIKDLPDPLPVEFRAHFATALLNAPKELRDMAQSEQQSAVANQCGELVVSKIVSDDELKEAFANTNFGGTNYRAILLEGVEKTAAHWHNGWTLTQIIRRLGLGVADSDGTGNDLTQKGLDYIKEQYTSTHQASLASEKAECK